MRNFVFLFGLVVLALVSGRALAHSELVAAEPPPGAQLAESPPEIRLTLSEPVAANSQIVIMGANFQQVEGLVTQFNPAQPQVVYAPLPPLEAGVYTVQWTAASADGHDISGSYSFSVSAAGPGAVSDSETVLAAGQEATTIEGPASRSVWWLAAIGIIAVGLPLVLLGFRRAGRHGDG